MYDEDEELIEEKSFKMDSGQDDGLDDFDDEPIEPDEPDFAYGEEPLEGEPEYE